MPQHRTRSPGAITSATAWSRLSCSSSDNAVHPRWQNRGVAQVMYAHVFARLRQLGMRAVRVNTGGDPSHAPARRAYEKAGFAVGIPCVDYYRKL